MGRGAVVYDYLLCRGGAERLTVELARGLEADLWSAFRDHKTVPDKWLEGVVRRELGGEVHHPAWRALRAAYAFEHAGDVLQPYDWVIFGGSYAPLAVTSRRHGGNIYYCHTPPRFIYDLRDWYLNSMPWWQRPLLRGLIGHLQPRYETAVGRMDRVVANSECVRWRLREHLGVEAEVVHPPCDVERWRWLGEGEFYLSTARLEPYKRVECIVEAFLHMPDRRLVVASGGSEEGRLRRLADGAPNIEFVGWLDDAALADLLGRAVATLYLPREEDFGMSPVESMAAGKPVIGVAEGGMLETVIDGETGRLLPEVGVEAVVEAVEWMTPRRAVAMREACERRAARFSQTRFIERMGALIE